MWSPGIFETPNECTGIYTEIPLLFAKLADCKFNINSSGSGMKEACCQLACDYKDQWSNHMLCT